MTKEAMEALNVFRQQCAELRVAAAQLRVAQAKYDQQHQLWEAAFTRAKELGAL